MASSPASTALHRTTFYSTFLRFAWCCTFALLRSVQGVAIGNVTQEQYNAVVTTQLTELWTNYGPLVEIWFDGGVLPLNEVRLIFRIYGTTV